MPGVKQVVESALGCNAVVSEVTLWPLLVLFVLGVPAAALWAYARALREDG